MRGQPRVSLLLSLTGVGNLSGIPGCGCGVVILWKQIQPGRTQPLGDVVVPTHGACQQATLELILKILFTAKPTLKGVAEAARKVKHFHVDGLPLTDGDQGPAGTTCCVLSAGNQFKGHAPDKWFCNQSKPTRVLASVTAPCTAQAAS